MINLKKNLRSISSMWFFLILGIFFTENLFPNVVRVKSYDQIKASLEGILNLSFRSNTYLNTAWQIAAPVLPTKGIITEISEEGVAGILGLSTAGCLLRYEMDAKLPSQQRWMFASISDMGEKAIFKVAEGGKVLKEMSQFILNRDLSEIETEIILSWDVPNGSGSGLSQKDKYSGMCAMLLSSADFNFIN